MKKEWHYVVDGKLCSEDQYHNELDKWESEDDIELCFDEIDDIRLMKQQLELVKKQLQEATKNLPNTHASNVQIPDDAYEYEGHYYYVYCNVCDTWDEAKNFCEEKGGYLAVISSSKENEALYNYITSSGIKTAYFGYVNAKDEYSYNDGEWEWTVNENSDYTNWHENEPNNDGGENYAELYWKYEDGTWNDGNFGNGTQGDSKNFICEWADN